MIREKQATVHAGDELPLLLSLTEAARLLGVGETLARDLVRSGQLQTRRLGRRVLVPRAALEQLAMETKEG